MLLLSPEVPEVHVKSSCILENAPTTKNSPSLSPQDKSPMVLLSYLPIAQRNESYKQAKKLNKDATVCHSVTYIFLLWSINKRSLKKIRCVHKEVEYNCTHLYGIL
jgi:hypothetical protein